MGKCQDLGALSAMMRLLSKFMTLLPNRTASNAPGAHRSSTSAWTPSMVQLGTSVSSAVPSSSMSTSTSWTGISVGRSKEMWVPSSPLIALRTRPVTSA